jgi:hypothetical protein
MFRRQAILAVVGAALSFGGCDHAPLNLMTSTDGHEVQQSVMETAATGMVPISWSFRAVASEGSEMIPCLLPNGEPFVLPGGPALVPGSFTVTGTLSHVGRIEEGASVASIHECWVKLSSVGMPEAVYGPATAHLEGTQGDAIELSGTLTNWILAGYAVGEWDIVGGAGRFEGAEGYLDTVEYPAQDGTGSVGTGSGMITRPQPLKGGRPR